MEHGGAPHENPNNPNENINNHNRQNSQDRSNHQRNNSFQRNINGDNNLRRQRRRDPLMHGERYIRNDQGIATGIRLEANMGDRNPYNGDVYGVRNIIGQIIDNARHEQQFPNAQPRNGNGLGHNPAVNHHHEAPAIPDSNHNTSDNHNTKESEEADGKPEVDPAPKIDRPPPVETDSRGIPLSDFSFPKMGPIEQPMVREPDNMPDFVKEYLKNHPWNQGSEESSESTLG